MANISALLEIIRTAHLGRDMRQALHDSIDAVNDDVETCGQTLNVSSDKLQLKRGSTVLSEVTMPSGDVDSVNGQTGDVELDADDISDSSTTNKFVTDTEKSTWNGKSTVSVTQRKSSGENIADITIDGVTTKLYASAGGGGGGAVDSVNGMTGDVVLDVDDINDVDINNLADGQTLVYDATSGKWVNGSGGGGTSDYTDLTNKPQINGVTLIGNKTSGDLGLASADDVNSKANKSDITSIVATGTTNNTGNTITNGQLFYLNGTLCKALSNIASGSAFTLNTNYEVKNLNDELADRPLKYKYVQPRYNSATTAGNTYVISNALNIMGLQPTDTVCGLLLASISGNSGEDGGQAFYINFNDTIEFTPKSGNTSYSILNMVVFYK